MGLFLGNAASCFSDIRVGNTQVTEVYVGSTLVWPCDQAGFYGHGIQPGSFSYSGGTRPPVSVPITGSAVPNGWTLIVFIWTGEAETLDAVEPASVSVDGSAATQFSGIANIVRAGQPGTVNWSHKWTRWRVENWTGGSVSNVVVDWPADFRFSNAIQAVVFAAPPLATPVYGADYASGIRFTESAVATIGAVGNHYHFCVASSTDTSQTEGTGITATSNAAGLIASGFAGGPVTGARTIHWAVYAPNGSASNILIDLPGTNTGAGFCDGYVQE
jgi:hypothetical protein